jgi:hypothetical protein
VIFNQAQRNHRAYRNKWIFEKTHVINKLPKHHCRLPCVFNPDKKASISFRVFVTLTKTQATPSAGT